MKKYFIFHNQEILLHVDNFSLLDHVNFNVKIISQYNIGIFNECECIAIEIEKNNPDSSYAFFSFRTAIEKIGKAWFGAATRAFQIIQWDRNHQFCGKCGHATKPIDHQFEKRCDYCQLSFFPKLSPAIIVLVKKGNQILLARQKSFAPGVYALIAGFIEVGETIEDAVHREVLEEVGITIKNVRYFGSQPWPFPDSLMIGFIADYDAGEIHCRDGELEIAGWYDKNNIPGFPSFAESIGRKMIDGFLSEGNLSGK